MKNTHIKGSLDILNNAGKYNAKKIASEIDDEFTMMTSSVSESSRSVLFDLEHYEQTSITSNENIINNKRKKILLDETSEDYNMLFDEENEKDLFSAIDEKRLTEEETLTNSISKEVIFIYAYISHIYSFIHIKKILINNK